MKKINNVLIFLCSLTSICVFIKDFNAGVQDRFLADLSMIVVLLIPKIVRALFKIKISDALEFVFVIFMILAQLLGSVLCWYDSIWWYDLFAHFLSGVLTSILALVIMNWMKINVKNKWFNVIFMIGFTLMVASLWEFGEYAADLIMKTDVQHVLDTGVSDTMEDMLIAFFGSVITCALYLFDNKKEMIKKIVSKIK